MNYDPKWDLSTIPDEVLKSERARRNGKKGLGKKKREYCIHCPFCPGRFIEVKSYNSHLKYCHPQQELT